MIVFFIILTILFLLSLFFLLLCLSNLQIEINKLWFDSNNKKHQKLEYYLFYLRIKLLGKITWFKIEIDNKKINRIKASNIFKSKIFDRVNKFEKVQDIVLKNKKNIFKKENIKYIKELDIKLKKVNLYMELCSGSTAFTPFVVTTIASIFSIILAKNIEAYDRTEYNYMITPKYEYKPSLKIKLNCIIDIKIVHIINVIYMLIKKRRVEYDERTSDRRTYVCSND